MDGVHQRVPRGGKDQRSLVGCWRLDVGPSHRLPGYCPLWTRSMESWGFVCPDSTRSGDPDSHAPHNAIKIFQNILN